MHVPDTTGQRRRSTLHTAPQGSTPSLPAGGGGRRLVRALGVLTCALLVVPVMGGQAASAGTASVLEGEAMTAERPGLVRYRDARASAGGALNLQANGSVVRTVTTVAADELVLRLRGDSFSGAPRAVVRVDGVAVASLAVSATRWNDYVVRGRWAAAPHRVQVWFTNDLYARGRGDRNLHVDRFVFRSTRAASPASRSRVPAPAPRAAALDDAYESRIVALVNAQRARAGVAPLRVAPCADRHAEQWSARMAGGGRFAHRPDLGAVLRACSARGVGENIAYGNLTADQVMAMWMGSRGHRANILNPGFTHIGVGAARTRAGRTYATQNFLTL